MPDEVDLGRRRAEVVDAVIIGRELLVLKTQ
jgi:hypothetical protein